MTSASDSSNEWSDCPPGEIAGLVSRLNSARRRKTLQKAAAATSLVLVLAFVTTVFVSGWLTGRTDIPEIACDKVLELAPRYVQGRTEGDVTVQIDQHLKDCEHCREHFRQAYPEFRLPDQAAHTQCPPHVFAYASRLP
jgi:CRP-like cAMP-binding protein